MEYSVKKREFKKEAIEYIEMFFDNGDCIPISKTEIVDISTRLYDNLIMGKDYWNSFCVVIESGFLKIKLDPERNEWRKNNLFDKLAKGENGNQQIDRRLCGKKGFDLHDICHLYIDYD